MEILKLYSKAFLTQKPDVGMAGWMQGGWTKRGFSVYIYKYDSKVHGANMGPI